MKGYLPKNMFWQNENQQFTVAIVFAAFSLIIAGFYLLPSTTCIISTNGLLIFCSDDLNTKNFWIGVISSGFFFSTQQIIVKICGLLVYSGFCGFIVGLFTHIRSFQQGKDFCDS